MRVSSDKRVEHHSVGKCSLVNNAIEGSGLTAIRNGGHVVLQKADHERISDHEVDAKIVDARSRTSWVAVYFWADGIISARGKIRGVCEVDRILRKRRCRVERGFDVRRDVGQAASVALKIREGNRRPIIVADAVAVRESVAKGIEGDVRRSDVGLVERRLKRVDRDASGVKTDPRRIPSGDIR